MVEQKNRVFFSIGASATKSGEKARIFRCGLPEDVLSNIQKPPDQFYSFFIQMVYCIFCTFLDIFIFVYKKNKIFGISGSCYSEAVLKYAVSLNIQ